MQWIVVGIGLLVALGLTVVAIHLLLIWADRRGLVWYRNPGRRPPRSLGLVEEIYHPAVHHVVDEAVREANEADRIETGAPPEMGAAESTDP